MTPPREARSWALPKRGVTVSRATQGFCARKTGAENGSAGLKIRRYVLPVPALALSWRVFEPADTRFRTTLSLSRRVLRPTDTPFSARGDELAQRVVDCAVEGGDIVGGEELADGSPEEWLVRVGHPGEAAGFVPVERDHRRVARVVHPLAHRA